MRNCLACSLPIRKKSYKYCSLSCQHDFQFNEYITNWKSGAESGLRGIKTKVLSGYIERYLKKKYRNGCAVCGWNKIHPVTGRVPLEIDHIDGNSENNREENLRMVCPNCHALTENFRNLNRGKGRAWRLAHAQE